MGIQFSSLKNILVTLGFAAITFLANAQDNLIPNGDFEKLVSCPNAYDQIDKAEGWMKYKATPDLLSGCTHNKNIKMPNSFFGGQMAASGGTYAGFVSYYASHEADNEVFGIKLSEPLQKGTTYEVGLKVSLAETYSGFATNNICLLFTNQPEKDVVAKRAHLRAEEIIRESDKWLDLKTVFIADSNYAYAIIGNFFPKEGIKLHPRPQGRQGAAYYFIDDVYVKEFRKEGDFVGKVIDEETKQPVVSYINYVMVSKGNAKNSLKTNSKAEFIISKGEVYDIEVKAKGYYPFLDRVDTKNAASKDFKVTLIPLKVGKTIVMKNIFFDFGKETLQSASQQELSFLIQILKENSNMKIEIAGHTDNVGTEKNNQLLSEARTKSVADYLTKKGIQGERLITKGYGSTKPRTSNDSEQGRAQNRRVEFTILSK